MATQMTERDQARTIEATPAARAPRVARATFLAQVAALFLIAAGWGWNSGQFVQPLNTSWGPIADSLHIIPLVILVPLALRYIGAALDGAPARGTRNGITALAIFGIVGCTVMVVLGATNPDPNSVGVHTAEDWMPVIVQNAGNFLWLATLFIARRGTRA